MATSEKLYLACTSPSTRSATALWARDTSDPTRVLHIPCHAPTTTSITQPQDTASPWRRQPDRTLHLALWGLMPVPNTTATPVPPLWLLSLEFDANAAVTSATLAWNTAELAAVDGVGTSLTAATLNTILHATITSVNTVLLEWQSETAAAWFRSLLVAGAVTLQGPEATRVPLAHPALPPHMTFTGDSPLVPVVTDFEELALGTAAGSAWSSNTGETSPASGDAATGPAVVVDAVLPGTLKILGPAPQTPMAPPVSLLVGMPRFVTLQLTIAVPAPADVNSLNMWVGVNGHAPVPLLSSVSSTLTATASIDVPFQYDTFLLQFYSGPNVSQSARKAVWPARWQFLTQDTDDVLGFPDIPVLGTAAPNGRGGTIAGAWGLQLLDWDGNNSDVFAALPQSLTATVTETPASTVVVEAATSATGGLANETLTMTAALTFTMDPHAWQRAGGLAIPTDILPRLSQPMYRLLALPQFCRYVPTVTAAITPDAWFRIRLAHVEGTCLWHSAWQLQSKPALDAFEALADPTVVAPQQYAAACGNLLARQAHSDFAASTDTQTVLSTAFETPVVVQHASSILSATPSLSSTATAMFGAVRTLPAPSSIHHKILHPHQQTTPSNATNVTTEVSTSSSSTSMAWWILVSILFLIVGVWLLLRTGRRTLRTKQATTIPQLPQIPQDPQGPFLSNAQNKQPNLIPAQAVQLAWGH